MDSREFRQMQGIIYDVRIIFHGVYTIWGEEGWKEIKIAATGVYENPTTLLYPGWKEKDLSSAVADFFTHLNRYLLKRGRKLEDYE